MRLEERLGGTLEDKPLPPGQHGAIDHFVAGDGSGSDLSCRLRELGLRIDGDENLGSTGTDAVLAEMAGDVGDRGDLLGLVLQRPAALLDRLCHGRSYLTGAKRWRWACWLSELLWISLRPASAGKLTEDERDLLRPLAARVRFVVLSEPFRHRGDADLSAALGLSFGHDSRALLLARADEARAIWHRYLDEYRSHPELAELPSCRLEHELRQLAFRSEDNRLLTLSGADLSREAGPTARDRSTALDLVEGHFLPRFMLPEVAAVAWQFGARHRARQALAALVAATAVAAVVVSVWSSPHVAAFVAAGAYALVGIGGLVFGRAWSALWLLRQPAAGAVGLVALVSLTDKWWNHPSVAQTATATIGLGAAAFGYLVVEIGNHGVAIRHCVVRAFRVLSVGAVHAWLVSLVGLALVAPAYAVNGNRLRSALDSARGPLVLGLATAWCLAVGVFSQILWDDRPITAPLAHLTWRRGS